MKSLPKRWQDFLGRKPETGMGYQIVNLVLEDGRKIEDVVIMQGALVAETRAGNKDIDVDKITDIEVTHRKWKTNH